MKNEFKYHLLVVLILMFWISGAVHAELIVHWRFDEGSGTSILDSTENNLDGTLYNDANFSSDAKLGNYSLNLDGSGDYARIADNDLLNPGTGDFSYAFWMNTDTTARRFIMNKRNSGAGEWLAIEFNSQKITLNLQDGTGWSLWSTTTLSTNTWYHVAITADRDNGSNTRIYINGVDDTAGDPSVPAINYTNAFPMDIGRWSGGGYYWDGQIDDFRIYDHVLSQTEVTRLKDAAFYADTPTPANDARSIPVDQVLSWTEGADVNEHRLYLQADDPNLADVTPVIISAGTASYDPSGLEALTRYYWRVDEVDDSNHVYQGEAWNFTTESEDYRDDFASGTPASSWKYMWNKPDGWPSDPNNTTGLIGDPSCYADMSASALRYTPDGDSNTTNNPPAGALRLDVDGGHPGAAGSAGEQDRYAIAAYTVSFDGYYKISDSLIKGTNASSTGLDLLVHVDGDTPDVNLVSLQPNIEHSFDAYLGFLQSGQTIYVAVGPDGNASYDTFELDFSIAEYEPVLAARYSDSFAGEDEGWGYAWNEPDGWEPNGTTGTLTTGDLNDVSSHQDMIIVSTKYTPDGDVNFANNSPANALQLHSTGGHPGAAGGSGEPDRYAIATFCVSASGDYQIGHAWLESVSASGTGLELVVMVNGVEILAKDVAGATVERFDCHLGYLSLNDIVQVAVGPDGNASYDTFTWDFEIALVDPFFVGEIATLDIADFDAVGDGSTDDSNAISDAIQYASDSGLPTIIEFDGTKTYRIETGTSADGDAYAFNLYGASNIYLKGNGATLDIEPLTKIAYVKLANDIIVEGFTIEYNPLPYFQATIDDYDTVNNTVDVKVEARYTMPTLDAPGVTDNSSTWDFGRSWGNFREHFFIKTVKEIDAAHTDARIIRVTAQDQSASIVDDVGTDSDGMVIANPGYGQTGGSIFRVYNSSRIDISDILINTSPHLVFHVNSCPGPVTFYDVDMLVKDPNERFVSWRDMFHIKQNGYGVVWQECDLDAWAAYDDTWNLSSIWAEIDSIDGNSLTIYPAETFMQPWAVGDWVTCQNYLTGEILGSARLSSVINNGGTYDVELDRSISGMDTSDVLFNEEACNRGSIIRNCRSYNNASGDSGFSVMRLRTPTLFEDNNFDGLYMYIAPQKSIEGPIPQDIVFRRNVLKAGRSTKELMDAGFGLTGSNRGAVRNIVFEDNTFTESYLSIHDTIDIELINNTFTRTGSNTCLYVDDSGPVEFAGNLVNGSLRSYSNWISWDVDTTPATDFNELLNAPPSVHITLPRYWAEFSAPYTASVTVDASDADGSIANVKLYINDELVGTDSSAPYAWGSGDSLLENLPKGRYKLTAIATDNDSTTAETTSWFLVSESTVPVPVASWPFNEGTGSTAYDNIGPNAGTLYNTSEASWVAGVDGYAIDFDGSDDYVEISDNAALDLSTGDFSFSFWFNKDSLSRKFIYNQRYDGSNWVAIEFNASNKIICWAKIANSVVISMSTNTTLSADTDYHVVISADRSSAANSKICINGVDNTTITTMTTTNVSLAADVHIGRWSGGSGYNWDGMIDEFKIYDYAISADEANDLYYEFD